MHEQFSRKAGLAAAELINKLGMSPGEYARRNASQTLTLGAMLDAMEPLMDSIQALERKDEASLHESASMARLEGLRALLFAQADAFAHDRTSVEADKQTMSIIRKNAPWLP